MELIKEVRELVKIYQVEQKKKAEIEYSKIVAEIKTSASYGQKVLKIPKNDVNHFICEMLREEGFTIKSIIEYDQPLGRLSITGLVPYEKYEISW